MASLNPLIEKHNLIGETKFQLKSVVLILKRKIKNTTSATKTFTDKGLLKSLPVISVSESKLWNTDDNEQNWILTAGKIQNLRLASRRLNGIEINANETFSFWKHIGNPNLGQGYVVGREIREGCIVPTIAGGLCQLSNALYDAALKANFEITERHRHTKVIKGSLAEQDRDATVKWNYIDLRFKSKHSFRIEIDITSELLIVKFLSKEINNSSVENNSNAVFKSAKLNDCYSCGNWGCFRHPEKIPSRYETSMTTFLLDEKWKEYEHYISNISTEKDIFILPLKQNKFLKANRFIWNIKSEAKIKTVTFTAIKRSFLARLAVRKKQNPFASMIRFDKKIAGRMINHIPVESTHLIVSQNLLPFLLEEEALGGRTYDVLMNRLPIEKLHQRLDLAHKIYPESNTLNDFRASQDLIDLENIALTRSRHIITPHRELADIFQNKSIKLEWHVPKQSQNHHGTKILFPASSLGRKGAYEIRRLAKDLNLTVVLTGRATESEEFWNGIKTEFAGIDPFNNIGLIIHPAHVENQPRLLLKALSKGIPVITTTASGLSEQDNLTILPIGNYELLIEAVSNWKKTHQHR